MRSICTLLFCLGVSVLSAEVIQNVEYNIPFEAKDWVNKRSENEKSLTIIYLPKDSAQSSLHQFFAAHHNNMPSSHDPSEIKFGIQTGLHKMYPNATVVVTPIAKKEDGIIYEWTAKEGDVEKVHGWGRVISNNEGSVLLGYQTEDISNVEKARKTWLPVLETAKKR